MLHINIQTKLFPNLKIRMQRKSWIISAHPDKDHITGLDIIDENFEIGEIWESGFRRSEDEEECAEYNIFLELVDKITTKQLSAGSNKLPFSVSNVEAYCLCSKSNDDDDIHYNSLVVKFVEGSKSIIFAGDSNCEAWKNKVVKHYKSFLTLIYFMQSPWLRTFF